MHFFSDWRDAVASERWGAPMYLTCRLAFVVCIFFCYYFIAFFHSYTFNDDLLFIYSDRSQSDKVIVVVSFGYYS